MQSTSHQSDLEYLRTVIRATSAVRDAARGLSIAAGTEESGRSLKEIDNQAANLCPLIGQRLIDLARKVGHPDPASWGLPFIKEVNLDSHGESSLCAMMQARHDEMLDWIPFLTETPIGSNTIAGNGQQQHAASTSGPLKNFYLLIVKQHKLLGGNREAIVAALKNNKDFVERCSELKKTLDTNLVKSAVQHASRHGY